VRGGICFFNDRICQIASAREGNSAPSASLLEAALEVSISENNKARNSLKWRDSPKFLTQYHRFLSPASEPRPRFRGYLNARWFLTMRREVAGRSASGRHTLLSLISKRKAGLHSVLAAFRIDDRSDQKLRPRQTPPRLFKQSLGKPTPRKNFCHATRILTQVTRNVRNDGMNLQISSGPIFSPPHARRHDSLIVNRSVPAENVHRRQIQGDDLFPSNARILADQLRQSLSGLFHPRQPLRACIRRSTI